MSKPDTPKTNSSAHSFEWWMNSWEPSLDSLVNGPFSFEKLTTRFVKAEFSEKLETNNNEAWDLINKLLVGRLTNDPLWVKSAKWLSNNRQ